MSHYVYIYTNQSWFWFAQIVEEKLAAPKEILVIEYKPPVDKTEEDKHESPPSPPEPVKPEVKEVPVVEPPDLLVKCFSRFLHI